jgi:hypothetical protein
MKPLSTWIAMMFSSGRARCASDDADERVDRGRFSAAPPLTSSMTTRAAQ